MYCKWFKFSIMQKNYPECLGMKQQPKNNQTINNNTTTETSSSPCDCKSKQYEWYLFNRFLAVPEYIIEFEYLTKVFNFFSYLLNNYIFIHFIANTKSVIENIFDKEHLTNINYKSLDSNKSSSAEEKSKETIISTQSSSISSDLYNTFNTNSSTETILKKEIELLVQSDDLINLENLVEFNLHNCHIFTLNTNTDIINFNNLKKLEFSFNKLRSIDELSLLVIFIYFYLFCRKFEINQFIILSLIWNI
jgi:hypothetical protein